MLKKNIYSRKRMTADQLSNQIGRYIPEDAVEIIVRLIIENKISLTIARSRRSLYGDYRWPQKNKGHRISVNGDLNKYAFFITLVHEMAHLITWVKFKNAVSSHGAEWKHEFKSLMDEFKGRKIFPIDITLAFKQHLLSPSFTHCMDEKLMKALKKYDAVKALHVEDLANNDLFEFGKGRIFRRETKLRKRYRCIEVKTNRVFLFNALAEIKKP
ncbi:MAG: SprT-like domain-containing protein [Chitinophagales bacterium]|nr:SprT-like domain-containing protein [Chitinophagales bacterium]